MIELGLVLAIFGAALAVALAGIGSSIGIGLVGQTSAGVMTEDPEKFGGLMLLNVLPGTQGIYGFVCGFLVMFKIGIFGGELVALNNEQGLQIFMACMPIALTGLVSAIHQGRVCAAGAEMVAKQPGEVIKPMILAVFVEFYAVLGFLATVFLWMGIKVG